MSSIAHAARSSVLNNLKDGREDELGLQSV